MMPVISLSASDKLISNPDGSSSVFPFPPNIAEELPPSMRKRIMRWMLSNYIWPQVIARQPYEKQWDELLSMARAEWKISDMKVDEKTRLANKIKQDAQEGNASPSQVADMSDTCIFDAIDRLTNLNHYISFKEDMPVQFGVPKYVRRPLENQWYSPTKDLVDAANSLLAFSGAQTDFYRKHRMQAMHHYVYGVSYAISEYEQAIDMVPRRDPTNPQNWIQRPELTKINVSFEGISIRKLWLNVLISPYNMEHQPCPFFYETIPKFAIVANPYKPGERPFGYSNLNNLPTNSWLFSQQETNSLETALKQLEPNMSLAQLGDPKLNVNLKWTFYPMLPLQKVKQDHPQFQEEFMKLQGTDVPKEMPEEIWAFDDQNLGTIPLKRYLTEAFGNGLLSGQVEFIRIQENFYPGGKLPLFGSAHMPDMDSGAYSPAIGKILRSHYVQIVKAINQTLVNKDLLNDPPVKMQIASPSQNRNVTTGGQNNPVNSMNDYEPHPITDATGTTPQFIQAAREQIQTSSKSTDAVLGKAMGSRTSATEATNVFQTAMSGITTDLNMFNHDISGGYAERVWSYFGLFTDPDILKAITGQFGFAIKPEHFLIRLDIAWSAGSTFIESLTRQQNYRYLLESTQGNPSVNSAELMKELMAEWGFANPERFVNDGEVMDNVQLANDQATSTYMGDLVMVDPEQNHQIAIKVKSSYLKDRNSVWNTKPEYAIHGRALVDQIMVHSKFIQLQQMQAQLQAEAGFGSEGGDLQSLQSPSLPAIGNPAQINGGIL